jgi:diguanylate cyclase (GGDEF)-like protein
MSEENQEIIEKFITCTGSVCRIEKITPLAKQLNSLDLDKIAETCITDIPELIGAKLVSLYILDEMSDILHLEKNNHPFLINNIVSLNQNPPTPMVSAVRSKELVLINDMDAVSTDDDSTILRPFARNYSTKSCIIAPLICHDRVVGVLNMTDKIDGSPFKKADVAVIDLFRQLIGASLGNVGLFEKSQRLAQTDGLTGMYNHRTFYEMLEVELRRSQRYGGQLSIIMADIDNLKPINDIHGHRAGDMAIRQVSRRISACIRQIDVAARYGGDEFAVILPNTSLDDAITVAERIVNMVTDTPMMWEHHELPLSVSVGVGEHSGDTNPGEVTKATDQAMYAAKQSGKGKVMVFSKDA